mgnify:CR=1 FL=1
MQGFDIPNHRNMLLDISIEPYLTIPSIDENVILVGMDGNLTNTAPGDE